MFGPIKNCNEIFFAVLAGVIGSFITSGIALAAPAGVALVVGNAAYQALPPLAACALSARSVSAVLKGHGYDVIYQSDLSTGQLDAATGLLTEKLAASPDAPVVIYVCGYVSGFNGRPFLVPVSAGLQRPSDVLTQGMLAKAVVDVAARSGKREAMVVLEAVSVPGSTEPLALEALDRPDLPPGLSLLAVTETAGEVPMPLVTSLVPRLKVVPAKAATLIEGVTQDLADLRTATVSFRRVAVEAGYLVGGPAPQPPPPEPVQKPAPVVSAQPPSIPEVASLPDEYRMSDPERRSVQVAMAKIGYYPGPIDGIFGPESRAAIRRLQHELQLPLTGYLTAAQARKLMAFH